MDKYITLDWSLLVLTTKLMKIKHAPMLTQPIKPSMHNDLTTKNKKLPFFIYKSQFHFVTKKFIAFYRTINI